MSKIEEIIETLKAEKDVKETQLIEIREEFGVTDPAYEEQEKVIERYSKAISVLENYNKLKKENERLRDRIFNEYKARRII